MWSLIKSLLAPLSSLAFMFMASGLFNTFVSIRLEMEEFNIETIGIVTSSLYLGVLVGSLRIDRWIMKMGHIRSFVTLATLLISLALFQSFWVNSWYWCLLRFLGGICTAGIFVVIESWILMQSAPNLRGGILSIYLAVSYGALSLGQFLVGLADPMGIFPFIITALLISFSILPISLQKTTEPIFKETARLNLNQLFRKSPLGLIGSTISGMILASLFGLIPVYAKEIGMNVSQVGTFMAVMIFGGFSLQYPVGRWADRTDRRFVIQIMSFLAALFGLVFIWIEQPYFLQLIFAWFFGGFSCSLYPLSMAYACERVSHNQIVAATGGFILSYGLGSILGPLLAPIAMNLMGPGGLFFFLSTITLILGLVSFKRPASVSLD